MTQKMLISTNPSRGYEVLGEVEVSSEEDVAAKVAAARVAQKDWAALGVEGRIEKMKNFIFWSKIMSMN